MTRNFFPHFSYLYPALVADLLENWCLPLTDFMQRVETYYGPTTRQRLDTDSVVTRQTLRVAEWHLYGSSRLGIYKTQDTLRTVDLSLVYKLSDINLAPTQTLTKKEFYSFESTYTHHCGDKLYEGSNHLGNVLVTFSDKRLATCTEGQVHYQADVRSATDYAAFGALLDDRQWYRGLDSGVYRYGFNSYEKDNELKGTGNSYDFGARIYDSRLRWLLSVDPRRIEFAEMSAYSFAANCPIILIDQFGEAPAKPEPTDKDKLKITKIVSDYGSSFLGLIPGAGVPINMALSAHGTNFSYAAFWRLAHNIDPNSYVGALGKVGEGIAGHREFSFFNSSFASGMNGERGKARLSFGNKHKRGTWDFSIAYTSLAKGMILFENESKADGSPVTSGHSLNQGQVINLFYAVKTLSKNTDVKDLKKFIEIGVSQTIDNIAKNPSSGSSKTMGILMIDRDAYIKAYSQDPVYFNSLYIRLKEAGGSLHLINGLFTESKTAVDQINEEIRNETSNIPK